MSPAKPGMAQYRITAAMRGPGQIPMGPDHPTLDGLPTVALRFEDGQVAEAEWVPGTVHRGVEKLFESRDYRQILALVDRHDWLSAFCSEIGLAVGIEASLGLVPPHRAQLIRILLCEMTRIAHHLAFLAPLPGPMPEDWRTAAWAWRDEVLDLLEQATGHRVHPMFCQVGGVRDDVTGPWLDRVGRAAGRWTEAAPDGPELQDALNAHYAGVAVLGRADALAHGASGSVARASGVDLDLRRDDPCLPYPPFDVPVDRAGDARARVLLLVGQVRASARLVAWARDELVACQGQAVAVRLPKVLRVPEGTRYTWTENPTGINGYLLVSGNDRSPWRLKLRSAGFGNAAALGTALVGTRAEDLPAAIAGFLLICGDIDR